MLNIRQKTQRAHLYRKENFQVYQELFREFLEKNQNPTRKQYRELKNLQEVLALSEREVRAAEALVKKRMKKVKQVITKERLPKPSWLMQFGLGIGIIFLGVGVGGKLTSKMQMMAKAELFWPLNEMGASLRKTNPLPKFELNQKKSKVLSSLKIAVNALALSRDGELLVLAGENGQIWVGSLKEKKPWVTLLNDSQSHINSIAISDDGLHLVTGDGEGILKVWHLEENQLKKEYSTHSPTSIASVALSPDGQYLASGDITGTIGIWHQGKSARVNTLRGHSASVTSLGFTSSGQQLISASTDSTIRVWNIQTGKLQWRQRDDRPILTLALAPNHHFITGSNDGTVKLWDLKNREELGSYKSHDQKISGIAATEHSIFISASNDRTLRAWDAHTKNNQQLPQPHASYVNSVAISADGKTLVSASKNEIFVWDARD